MQPLWKAEWSYLKKFKMKLTYDSAISLLGTYLKKNKILIEKNTCTPMFVAVLFTITKIWKQLTCPSVQEWIKLGHLHNGILAGHKKKRILFFVTAWMDMDNIILSETSQSEKDKYHMISLICGI